MALDDRILCAAPSCYITSLERLFATLGPQDAEQNITGQVAFGMDHADYLTMRAPRPTLVLCGTRDFFDIQGTWASFREAKQVYGILGQSDRIDIAEFNQQHGYPKPEREAMVRWMRRWLLDKHDPVSEPEFTLYKEAELRCTRTGQVLEDFKGKSVVDLNVEREKELAAERTKKWNAMSREEQQKAVRKLLDLPDTVPAAKRKVLEQIKNGDYIYEKVLYTTEPGITLPAIEIRHGTRKPRESIIVVSDRGKDAFLKQWKDTSDGKKDRESVRLVVLDLRGFGESAPGKLDTGRPQHFGVDFAESFLALHLNRPLLGQRTFDLLSVIRALSAQNERPLAVWGVGNAAPVALHAGLLNPDPVMVAAEDLLLSWSSVVSAPISSNQLTSAVPGVLAVYDLPNLCSAAGGKGRGGVFVISVRGPKGEEIKKEEWKKTYEEMYADLSGIGWLFKGKK
jgi:hypothetical protein